MSFDVRSQISAKLLDPPAHLCGVPLNLRDVEHETRCFQCFKFHCVNSVKWVELLLPNARRVQPHKYSDRD